MYLWDIFCYYIDTPFIVSGNTFYSVMKINFSGKLFLIAISFSVITAIGITAYNFLWLQDYHFIVEASCDPSSEKCFVRDCITTDECPPNELGHYKVFEVSANDFSQCADNSCGRECREGKILCIEVVCGDSPGDECQVPETSENFLEGPTTNNQSAERESKIGEAPTL